MIIRPIMLRKGELKTNRLVATSASPMNVEVLYCMYSKWFIIALYMKVKEIAPKSMQPRYRDPNKPYWHDYLMNAVILPFIPKKVHPNHVTVFRLLATPFVIWGLAVENYVWAIPFFIFVLFTDVIDGSLARMRGLVTDWGTLYDPIADKTLIALSAVIVVTKAVGWWLVVLVIFFDMAIALGGVKKMHGGKIRTANYWGKSKMGAQSAGLIIMLFYLMLGAPWLMYTGIGFLLVSVVLALMSLITYSL